MKSKTFKAIGILLLALGFIFVACSPDDSIKFNDDDEYVNPNDTGNNNPNNPNTPNNQNNQNPPVIKGPYDGQSQDITFSHNSGLYAEKFDLELTAGEGKTIYYTLDGSIPAYEADGTPKSGTFEYTAPIPIINRNNPMQDNVLSSWDNHIRMYMNYDTDFTRENNGANNSRPYDGLNNDAVPKATVIRAVAVQGNTKSEVLTRTYFVGSNNELFGNTSVRIISLVADPDDLVSDARGIMVTGGPGKVWEHSNPAMMYNYRQRGEAWERAAAFELFEGVEKKPLLSTNVGIRIRGGWSRANGQKSFNIYFRSDSDLRNRQPNATLSGINNFVRSNYNFNLIEGAVNSSGQPIHTVKSFMLRSGGNDSDQTKFYDPFIHDRVKDLKFTTQASQPIILYLNGEYWGPYNMGERYSDNFYEYKYGVPRGQIISIDNGELDDGNPGEEQTYWWNLLDELINLDMSQSPNYAKFTTAFDEQSFIDYWTAQIYINNEDWPHNNYIVWRSRTNAAGNSYGDTKWRYSLHDTEYSMGIYDNGTVKDAIGRIKGNDHAHNQLFMKLLENPGFLTKFETAIQRLMDVNFNPSNFGQRLTYYENLYRPLMRPDGGVPGYGSRWSMWRDFDKNVTNARTYLTNVRTILPIYLNLHLYNDAPALQETLIGSYEAHSSNPYIDLTSSAPYQIVTIQGITGYVMKVANPDCWGQNQWQIAYKNIGSQYKNQDIYIKFTCEIYRAGEAGPTNWQLENPSISQWPLIGGIWYPAPYVWHTISTGTGDGNGYVRPVENEPMFSFGAWDEGEDDVTKRVNARTVFYIANYSMTVVSQ